MVKDAISNVSGVVISVVCGSIEVYNSGIRTGSWTLIGCGTEIGSGIVTGISGV